MSARLLLLLCMCLTAYLSVCLSVQEVVRLRAGAAVDALRPWQLRNALACLHQCFRTASTDTKTAFCKQLLVLNLRCPQVQGTEQDRKGRVFIGMCFASFLCVS